MCQKDTTSKKIVILARERKIFDMNFCKNHNCSNIEKLKRIFKKEYEYELLKFAEGKLTFKEVKEK